MDNSTRLQYLEAMGIDVWVSRNQSMLEQSPAVEVADLNLSGAAVDKQSEATADSWALLQEQVTDCHNCSLSETRKQTVFGVGDGNADWMLIGEAPGQNEELEGKPFLGSSGFLLTEMLRAINLQREDVFITNVLKCSPPKNRDPKVDELKSCHEYLQRQISLVNPKIILAVGRIAAQTLLGTKQALSELRGKPHQLNGIPVVVVYHPAYLLRSLLEKRKAWQDLQLAMKIYQEQ